MIIKEYVENRKDLCYQVLAFRSDGNTEITRFTYLGDAEDHKQILEDCNFYEKIKIIKESGIK